MPDRPIINAASVPAILDSRKTQTRRPVSTAGHLMESEG
jgi:hypothetical protein